MIGEIFSQRHGRALIEWNAHSRGFQRARGVLENEPGLFARDTGKPHQKIRQLRPILQILEQRGDGNARTAEHPCAADAAGIPLDGRTGRPIDHVTILEPWAASYNLPETGILNDNHGANGTVVRGSRISLGQVMSSVR